MISPIARRAARAAQRGYALILAMVALVTLTIMGVTAISVAQMDMSITQNLRHHRQHFYAAMAGEDQARALVRTSQVDVPSTIEVAAAQANDCIADWIGTAGTSVAAPTTLASNGYDLGTYDVTFCVATCGEPVVGNSLGEGLVGYTIDVIPTGAGLSNPVGTAQVGGLLYGQMPQGLCE